MALFTATRIITLIQKSDIQTQHKIQEMLIDIETKIINDLSSKIPIVSKPEKVLHQQLEFASDCFRKTLNIEGKLQQIEVIAQAHFKKEDILTVFPSGFGKSAIYQTLIKMDEKGVTLIIEPLLSIIQDQEAQFNALGIKTIAFLPNKFDFDLNDKTVKALLITPEKLMQENVLEKLKTREVTRIVIDEAHCILWDTFRDKYKELSKLRKFFQQAQFIALTATASKETQLCIAQKLNMDQYVLFQEPIQRRNIEFYVMQVKDKMQYLEQCITWYQNEAGIVYCTSKKTCEKVYKVLKQQNLKIAHYHGDLPYNLRHKVLHEWLIDSIQIIVSTVALGIGVNKQNVRFVIHYDFPQSLDTYIQQCGRAGRDNKKAVCIMLFKQKDITISKFLSMKNGQMKSFYELHQYCITTQCRSVMLGRFFNDPVENKCLKCDNCIFKKGNNIYKDCTNQGAQILGLLELLAKHNMHVSFQQAISFLRGTSMNSAKSQICKQIAEVFQGNLKHLNDYSVQTIMLELLCRGLLVETPTQYSMWNFVISINPIKKDIQQITLCISNTNPLKGKKIIQIPSLYCGQQKALEFKLNAKQKEIKQDEQSYMDIDTEQIKEAMRDSDLSESHNQTFNQQDEVKLQELDIMVNNNLQAINSQKQRKKKALVIKNNKFLGKQKNLRQNGESLAQQKIYEQASKNLKQECRKSKRLISGNKECLPISHDTFCVESSDLEDYFVINSKKRRIINDDDASLIPANNLTLHQNKQFIQPNQKCLNDENLRPKYALNIQAFVLNMINDMMFIQNEINIDTIWKYYMMLPELLIENKQHLIDVIAKLEKDQHIQQTGSYYQGTMLPLQTHYNSKQYLAKINNQDPVLPLNQPDEFQLKTQCQKSEKKLNKFGFGFLAGDQTVDIFKCSECFRRLKTKGALTQHIKRKFCAKQSAQIVSITPQIKRYKKILRKASTRICQKYRQQQTARTSENQIQLSDTQNNELFLKGDFGASTQNQKLEQQTNNVACDMCQKMFKTRASLVQHKRDKQDFKHMHPKQKIELF